MVISKKSHLSISSLENRGIKLYFCVAVVHPDCINDNLVVTTATHTVFFDR
jgi:hypothetical protein